MPALAVAASSLAACSVSGPDSAKPAIVASFYPQQYLAEQIGGEYVEVTSLAKPGAEPHDMELSAQQIGDISRAELVLYQAGLQPAVDDAIENENPQHSLNLLDSVQTIPATDDHDHSSHDEGDVDPHVWLAPQNMQAMAEAIAKELTAIDPDHADDYETNLAALNASLIDLDNELRTGLTHCQLHDIVTTHTAFGYLTDAYGLEQIGIGSIVSEDNPSAADLQQAQQFAEEHGITTIFYETDGDPGYAETIAEEIGATTAKLSPLEVAPEDGDYLSTMHDNLEALRTALKCSGSATNPD